MVNKGYFYCEMGLKKKKNDVNTDNLQYTTVVDTSGDVEKSDTHTDTHIGKYWVL